MIDLCVNKDDILTIDKNGDLKPLDHNLVIELYDSNKASFEFRLLFNPQSGNSKFLDILNNEKSTPAKILKPEFTPSKMNNTLGYCKKKYKVFFPEIKKTFELNFTANEEVFTNKGFVQSFRIYIFKKRKINESP